MRVVFGCTRVIVGENGRIGPVQSRSTTSCNVFVDSLVTRFGHRETVVCGGVTVRLQHVFLLPWEVVLPTLLDVSLFLFFAGLVVFLHTKCSSHDF